MSRVLVALFAYVALNLSFLHYIKLRLETKMIFLKYDNDTFEHFIATFLVFSKIQGMPAGLGYSGT